MTSPYATQPLDALMAAQTSVGMVLCALVLFRRLRPSLATVLFLAAIALVVIAPVEGDFLQAIGLKIGPEHFKRALKLSMALASVSMLLTRRPLAIGVAVGGEVALWFTTNYLQKSDPQLAAIHLAFLGLLVGLQWRYRLARPSPEVPARPSPVARAWIDDVAVLVLGTLAGAAVSVVVLGRWTNSGDEWANTYQAAAFAKLHAYGSVPHCSEALRSFWVFPYMGRSFAQYTPGWPLFMAPFMWLDAPWLAGPVSLGLLASAACRLGRRAAAGFSPGELPPSASLVRAAGRFSALSILLGAIILINGASRYPHIFVAAGFAWSVECLCAIGSNGSKGLTSRQQWGWGAGLGLSTALTLAARPGDGVTLGLGIFVYFVYAFVRRRIPWRSLAGTAASFAFVSALTLVILRLQLGRWFATGYSLTTTFYPWVSLKWSVPQADQFRWGVPLDTGSYCWWPCSPAVGLAGIAALRGEGRRLGFIFACSFVPFCLLYTLLELGRGWDLGYGPRYMLPAVLPMAVGTGVLLAHLWTGARSRGSASPAWMRGGPVMLALAAVLLGVVRIAPLLYPPTFADVQAHNRLHAAIQAARVHDAVVFAGAGFNTTNPKDLTENLPLDLYPNQDVLIALDTTPELTECVRRQFPRRRFYRAVPGPTVSIVPY